MKVLLDTHIVIAVVRGELASRYPALDMRLSDMAMQSQVSVASLWEISIRMRLGKLDPKVPLGRLAEVVESYGFQILDINRHHAVAYVEPEPFTRDLFDRMLLAQCNVEGLQLVTLDRALIGHPLTFRWQA